MEATSIDVTLTRGGQVMASHMDRSKEARARFDVTQESAAKLAVDFLREPMETLRGPKSISTAPGDRLTVSFFWDDRDVRSAMAQFIFDVEQGATGVDVKYRGTRDPLMSTTRFDALDVRGNACAPSIRGASSFVDPTADQARQNVENAIPIFRRPGVIPNLDMRQGTALVTFQRFSDQSSLPTGFRIGFESDGTKTRTWLIGAETV